VLDGPVAEIAFLPEQLAVIGEKSDVGVLGDQIEHLFHNAVQIFDGRDLTVTEHFQLLVVEELLMFLGFLGE
jgi:hypothetical protein